MIVEFDDDGDAKEVWSTRDMWDRRGWIFATSSNSWFRTEPTSVCDYPGDDVVVVDVVSRIDGVVFFDMCFQRREMTPVRRDETADCA